jgi:nucleophosmin 3
LKGANSSVLWSPESTSGADELDYPRANKLIIKQILLGAEAKEGEYNVVEVKYPGNKKSITNPQKCDI